MAIFRGDVVWWLLCVVASWISLSCEARPSNYGEDVPRTVSFAEIDSYVVGGIDALPGAWPWQISQERLRDTGLWSHSCGGSLLNTKYVLSAAHCLEGHSATILRIIAGLHDRTILDGAQRISVANYIFHDKWDDGQAIFSNDIALMTLATLVQPAPNVGFATLPTNNNNDFAGQDCIITGWGRHSSGPDLPTTLQEGQMEVLSTERCRVEALNGHRIWPNHICLKSKDESTIACHGDSGGPANCPSGTGGYVVVGVASFVTVNGLNECMPTYPTGYTRVSGYLDWLNLNMRP